MRFSTSRRVAGAIVVVCMLSFLAIALTTESGSSTNQQDERAPYYVELDRLVEMFSQIIDQVRDTYYAASQGCNSRTLEELQVNAQVVLNLLEGADSPLFDESIKIPLYATIGLLPVVNAFSFSEGWFDPAVTSTTQRRHLELAYANIQGMMEFTSVDLQNILAVDGSFSDAKSTMDKVCRITSSLIMKIQEFLVDYGYEVWCGPGASLQGAIDGAREGATIYISPASFLGDLVIDKTIVLSGSSAYQTSAFEAGRQTFGASIEPDSGGTAIRIIAERPIQVTLQNLAIENAAVGVVVEGEAHLTMREVDLVDSDIAVIASESARVSLYSCRVENNHTALLLTGTSSTSVEDSVIQNNTDAEGCVQLTGGAILDVTSTDVSDNGGHGIAAQDESNVVVTDCLILRNAGDGIRLQGDCQLIMNQTACNDNAGYGVHAVSADCLSDHGLAGGEFTGSVLGSGNVYPASTDSSGNQLGGLCPADLFD